MFECFDMGKRQRAGRGCGPLESTGIRYWLSVGIPQPSSLRMSRLNDAMLADFFAPGFDILFHLSHELVGDCAVDKAMIVAQGEVDDGADGDGVGAIFVGYNHGLFGDAADAHDCGVRLVDDGQSEDSAELARVRNSKSGTFNIVGLELLGASALAEIGDTALQSKEIQVARILEDGNDESPVQRDSDAHVNLAVISNAVAFEAGIDDGPLLQGHNGGAHKERHEGKARTVALFESGFLFVA
jgi:hypothetical protein